VSLHVVHVKHPQGDVVPWYFEDHAHFIRAVKLAKDRNIWVMNNDGDPDIITDLDEFKNWLDEAYPDPLPTVRALVNDLIELGFDQNEPISGGDTVDVVAQHFDKLRKVAGL
jgi:hypothetical protein